MKDDHQEKEKERAGNQAVLPYEKPELRQFGELCALIRGTGGSNEDADNFSRGSGPAD